MFIDILNAPTKVVAVASQGQIYADKEAGYDKNVLLRGVLLLSSAAAARWCRCR